MAATPHDDPAASSRPVVEELVNPGKRGLSVTWALVFLSIGLFFAIAGPFPWMLLLVFPFFAYEFVGFLWDAFYRTPTKIRIKEDGLALSYRNKSDGFIPWGYIRKLEIPPFDPSTFVGRNLIVARLLIEAEKRPYNLKTTAGMAIRNATTIGAESSGALENHSR